MSAPGDTAGRNTTDALPGHVRKPSRQARTKKKKGQGQPLACSILCLGPQEALDYELFRGDRGTDEALEGMHCSFQAFIMENFKHPKVGRKTQYNLMFPSSRFPNLLMVILFHLYFHPLSPQYYFERNFRHHSYV